MQKFRRWWHSISQWWQSRVQYIPWIPGPIAYYCDACDTLLAGAQQGRCPRCQSTRILAHGTLMRACIRRTDEQAPAPVPVPARPRGLLKCINLPYHIRTE